MCKPGHGISPPSWPLTCAPQLGGWYHHFGPICRGPRVDHPHTLPSPASPLHYYPYCPPPHFPFGLLNLPSLAFSVPCHTHRSSPPHFLPPWWFPLPSESGRLLHLYGLAAPNPVPLLTFPNQTRLPPSPGALPAGLVSAAVTAWHLTQELS